MSRLGVAVAVLLVAAWGFPAAGHEAHEAVDVLFDFGDGRHAWGEADLSAEPLDGWNATVAAAEGLGYALNYTVFSFGVQLNGVGGELGAWPGWWWHLFLWNAQGGLWESSMAGASDLVLRDGDAIAWHRTVDDPQTFRGPPPIATPAHPLPWTSFRGSARNVGTVAGMGPLEPEVAWSLDTGTWEADGTPVVGGDAVYLETENGLFAVDRATGATRWSRPDLRGMAAPLLWNGALYLGAWDGKLHGVDATDGSEVWNVTLAADRNTTVSSSVTQYEGVGYVGTFNESGGEGALFAVDLFTGAVRWRRATASIHYSSPAVLSDLVLVGVVGLFNETALRFDPPYGLLAVRRLDGTEAWFVSTDGPVASTPAVAGDTVYFTSRGSRLYAVDLQGSKRWEAEIGYSTSSPAVAGDRVFVGSGSLGPTGLVLAFRTDGTKLWETAVNGGVQSAIVHAAGTVYASTNAADGSVYAIQAGTGKVLWRWTAEPRQYILGSPTVSEGVLYVATDSGHLFALQSGGGEEPPAGNTAVLVATALFAVLVVALLVLVARRKRGRAS